MRAYAVLGLLPLGLLGCTVNAYSTHTLAAPGVGWYQPPPPPPPPPPPAPMPTRATYRTAEIGARAERSAPARTPARSQVSARPKPAAPHASRAIEVLRLARPSEREHAHEHVHAHEAPHAGHAANTVAVSSRDAKGTVQLARSERPEHVHRADEVESLASE